MPMPADLGSEIRIYDNLQSPFGDSGFCTLLMYTYIQPSTVIKTATYNQLQRDLFPLLPEHRKISPPWFPREPHTAMSGSTSCSTSLDSTILPKDLSAHATALLILLCNTRDYLAASRLISPRAVMQHEDDVPRTGVEFLDIWKGFMILIPDLHMEVQEAIVDEQQRKV